MARFLIDFALVAVLVIGVTAVLGVATNGLGNHVFGRKHRSKFVEQSNKSISGFNMVGGKKD